MVHIELTFTNTLSNKPIQSIKFLKSNLNMQGFDDIDQLPTNVSVVSSIGIDFNDKTQPAVFDISFDDNPKAISLTISCPVGELIEQKFLNEQDFTQHSNRLRGMNEISDSITLNESQLLKMNFSTIQTKVIQCANMTSVPSSSGDATIYR